MENIMEIESAIRFCNDKIKESAGKQGDLLNNSSDKNEARESDQYKKHETDRVSWSNKKNQLEKIMEKKIMSIK